MGKKSGLIAVGLVLLTTAGCVEAGYPAPSYGYGYRPAYYNNSGYYNPGYYNSSYYNRSYYSNGYSYPQAGYYRPVPRHHHHGWDKNGDGVPDRWQSRW
jgi:hypothetical protein